MKVYRIKHLPTGLYFKPSSEVWVKVGGDHSVHVKTNLSKKGKVYTQLPSESWFTNGIYNHLAQQKRFKGITDVFSISYRERNRIYPAPREDWQIEEVT